MKNIKYNIDKNMDKSMLKIADKLVKDVSNKYWKAVSEYRVKEIKRSLSKEQL